VKGKEKQSVGELYDLFESVSRRTVVAAAQYLPNRVFFFLVFPCFQVASELWPGVTDAETNDKEVHGDSDDGDAVDVEEDFEKQLAKELATIKRPRKERRFGMSQLANLGPDIRVSTN
jgi:tRNA acetyltransferase TAN1